MKQFIDQIKNISQIEHSRHRSIPNFLVNLIAGIAAYGLKEKKLSIHIWLILYKHNPELTLIVWLIYNKNNPELWCITSSAIIGFLIAHPRPFLLGPIAEAWEGNCCKKEVGGLTVVVIKYPY